MLEIDSPSFKPICIRIYFNSEKSVFSRWMWFLLTFLNLKIFSMYLLFVFSEINFKALVTYTVLMAVLKEFVKLNKKCFKSLTYGEMVILTLFSH